MKNKLLLIIVALFAWINLHASSMSNDSTKLESIQKEMLECFATLQNRTDYNTDSYLKKVVKGSKKFNILANEYFDLTNDSSVFAFSFMAEFMTAAIYENHKQIDSAYIHSLKAYELYDPYGKMLCSSDTTRQWAINVFGNDGLFGIMRDWNVKQGNLDEALKYCVIIADSCRALNADIEVVEALMSKGKVYKQFYDFDNSIRSQVEALDIRLNMKDYSLAPFPSDIYSGILGTYSDWYSWGNKQSNNQEILQKFKSFNESFMANFLASHNFDFCIEEEKAAGNISSIRKLLNEFVGILELGKMYDTFFDYEKGFDDFYIRNYGENSVYYANWLLKKKWIYNTYISNNKHLESFYIRKADTFYNNAESIWNNYIIDHPLESLIQDYQNAKKTLSYNSLASDYLNIYEILSLYDSFLIQQEDVQLGTGRYTEAKYTIEKQIRLSEILELDNFSFLYSQMAKTYLASNEFTQAEKWYQKSLDIAIEKNDTIDMARANWSICNLYIRQHNNGLAKQALYKAYDLIMGTKERSIVKCCILKFLALYFNENYNYKLAYELYLQAVSEESSLGMSIVDDDYITLAEYYAKYRGQLTDFLLGHLIDISTRGDTTYSAQRAAAKVGAYYGSFTDDYEKALHYYLKAYHIAKNLNDSRSQFTYLSEIGVIYFIQKDYDNALKYMLKAEETCPEASSPSFLSLLTHIHNPDIVEDRIPKKFVTNKSYIQNQMLLLSGQGRESLLQEQSLFYEQFRSMPFYYPESNICASVSYNSVLFFKSLLLNTQKEISTIIETTNDDEIKGLYYKIQELKANSNVRLLLDEEQFSTKTNIEIERLETELISKLTKKKVLSFSDITWGQIQKRLKQNDVAIEFIEINNLDPLNHTPICYGALVLRKDYKTPVFVELDSKNTIDKLIKHISSSFNKGKKMNAEKWFDSSKQLYNSLWGKLDGHIKEGDNIYFSLDGLLYKAPIELLSDKNGKIVNEKFNLFRLSSTREICMKRRDEISKVVLYGGMFYDASPKGLEVDSLVAFKGYNDESARFGWSYLPASVTEVDSISSLLSTSGVSVVEKKGLNGTEESFRELSGSDFSIVHIATHGFYFPQEEVSYLDYFKSKVYISPMRRSGLMMTGGQAAWMGKKHIDPDHDGILTSEEISRLDLSDVSMVVLSACQTGLGDIDNGAEGVIGIQRAFKLAGVQSLLMSLWKVDDNATSYMMRRFYSRMVSGDTKHNAFKTAQQEVRKKYPNPYYWAGFILLD